MRPEAEAWVELESRAKHEASDSSRVRPVECETCQDVGWLCAATNKPADVAGGLCCGPIDDPEFGALGPSCPSANGCPDCEQRP